MYSHRVMYKCVVLVAVCIVGVFLFPLPSMQGPFTSVHGPVTALRAWQAAIAIQCGIALAAAILVFPLWLAARYDFALRHCDNSVLDELNPAIQLTSVRRC